jgi:hypothetical protein
MLDAAVLCRLFDPGEYGGYWIASDALRRGLRWPALLPLRRFRVLWRLSPLPWTIA